MIINQISMAFFPGKPYILRLLTLLVLGSPFLSFAQQDSYWYFGKKAALDFNVSGSLPVPRVVNNSSMETNEASAAVSDNSGSLLFYTNGVQVFNRNHGIMPNGDGLNGDISSCQIAVVPQPGSDSLFYIFTTDAFENDFMKGYYYSVVDMSGDGGLGDVVIKNSPLWSSCSERIAAVRHANGTDVWVITNDQNSNIFRAWLVTCLGLQPGFSVVSTVGEPMDQNPLMNVGVLKASPDGKYLCQTHFPFTDANSNVSNFIQLFDFDNASGVIRNPRKISPPATQYNHCEFSPDSKLLYLTRKGNKQLDQLDITLPSVADIIASRVSFPTVNPYYDIQLAMDEKIYLSQGNSQLAVINFPNIRGAGCSFQRNVINLNPGSAFVGLPSHINDIVAANNQGNGFNFTILDSCAGRVQFSSNPSLPGTLTWHWDFGDNSSSNLQNPLHVFPDPSSLYNVKLTITSTASCGKLVRSRIIRPSGMIKPKAGFTHVFVCDSGYVRFTNTSTDTTQPGIRFLWDFGDNNSSGQVNPRHAYAQDGDYPVKLKIITGSPCTDDSVSYLVSFSQFSIDVTPDQIIHFGETTGLNTDLAADSYDWSPGKWLSDSTIRNPVAAPFEDITYTLIATRGGCTDTDTVRITVIQNDYIYMPTGFTPNSDGKNDQISPLINGRITLKEFSIFNRNGERVFTSTRPGEGWDGRTRGAVQNAGVYVWVLKAIDVNGTLISRKGTLTLIR